MRIAQSGPYVMVKKFGIEGLLTLNKSQEATLAIESSPEKEEAKIVY